MSINTPKIILKLEYLDSTANKEIMFINHHDLGSAIDLAIFCAEHIYDKVISVYVDNKLYCDVYPNGEILDCED